jgi:hypothetical protein
MTQSHFKHVQFSHADLTLMQNYYNDPVDLAVLTAAATF